MNKKNFCKTAIALAVLSPFASSAAYLTPALTQGDDFNGLVWWHDGELYAKDQNGDVQQLEAVKDENGHRVTTAHIYGDIQGIALDYSFGWQGASNYLTDELVLEFDGNVDIAYSSDEYEGVSGNSFMVGTDTLDMTIKLQEGKTLSVGTPFQNLSSNAAFELTDYVDNEGNRDPVNLNIQGGNIRTHFDDEYSDQDLGLSVFATFKNDNGGILPGSMTINNESIVATLGRDYWTETETQTYGTQAHFSGINITTKTFVLGSEDFKFYTGFYGDTQSQTTINTEKLQAYTKYGIWLNNAKLTLISSDSAVINADYYGVVTKANSEAIIQEVNQLNINAGYYGLYSQTEDGAPSVIDINANNANITVNGGEGNKVLYSYASGASINIDAENLILDIDTSDSDEGNVLYANAGDITLNAKQMWLANNRGNNKYRIQAFNGSSIKVNSDEEGAIFLTGGVYAASGSSIELNFSKNSQWDGYAREGSNPGNINLSFKDQAKWSMAYDSNVSSLDFNDGGYVDLFGNKGAAYHLLSTKTLSGKNGTLGFRIDLANDSTTLSNDQLEVTEKASGNHYATITFIGDSIPVDKLYSENWLVSQADSDTNGVTFKNHDGTNKFTGNGMITTWSLLFTQDEDVDENTQWSETGNGKGYWHLVQTDAIADNPGVDDDDSGKDTPPEAQQIQNLGSSVAQAVGWLSEKNDLRRRLGEVRYGSQAGAWAKVFTRQDRAEGFRYNGFKQESTGVHVGYDTFATQNEHSAWLVGATLRYAHSTQEGLETAYGGDGKLKEYSGKIYATWMHESGSYMDILAQIGYYDQEINGVNNVGDGSFDANYHNWGYGTSIEVGHMFTLSNGADDRPWYNHWFLEPQLELSYFYVKGEEFKTSTGLHVDQGDADFLTGRAGFVLGKKVNCGTPDDLDKRWYQVGLIAGVTHEFLGDQKITFTGTEGKSAEVKGHGLGGTSFYYGVTADWQVTNNVRIYGELDREEGAHYTKDFGFNIGFKYSF